MCKKEKVKRNIIISPVGKHRPNAVNYKISLPVTMMNKLNVSEDDRTFNVYMEGDKIILEKIK
ncbi:MAG: hypothetical protein E6538_13360 [Paeniclostridium sordellii]|nr:hypothetical protein [Paeniclostridium sordellii]